MGKPGRVVGNGPQPLSLAGRLRRASTLGRPLRRSERETLRHALELPWCWPLVEQLQALARGIGAAEPSTPEPGRALIVSVTDSEESATLWHVGPREEGTHPLVEDAADTAALGWDIAARDLAVLATLEPLHGDRRLRARPVFKRLGTWHEMFLEGPSYGLACALAAASRLLRRPVPTDLAALATVEASGALGSVGKLDLKLSAIRDDALGVGCVLVCEEQAEEARALLANEWRGVEVLSARSLGEAAKLAFGDLAPTKLWKNEEVARRALELFYDQVLTQAAGLLGWGGIARAAERLRERFKDDDQAHYTAHFVAEVARRHVGESAKLELPADEWLMSLPRPLRLRHLAHVVQGMADETPLQPREAELERARRFVAAPAERVEGDWILLGAFGRAWAARRRYNLATEDLRAAVDGWFSMRAAHQASYSLSELIRVLGVLGRRGAVDALEQRYLPAFERDHRSDSTSKSFVRLAFGRACVLLGAPEIGKRHLAEGAAPWEGAPLHAQAARFRWLARAALDLGDPDAATGLRRQLEAMEYDDSNVYLARIDLALRTGATTQEHLHAWRTSTSKHELLTLLEQRSGGEPRDEADVARFVADEFRY